MRNQERIYSEEDIRRTRIVVLLFGVIILGVFSGTLLYCSRDDKLIFLSEFMCNCFIRTTETKSIIDVFTDAVSWTSALVILQFLLGFCAISQVVEISVLFYRGITLGISFAYTYSMYGKSAFGILLLMVLPHALITSVVLVLASREALRFSNSYICCLSGNVDDDMHESNLRLYVIRFIVLMLMVVVSAVIDSVITYLLTDILLM